MFDACAPIEEYLRQGAPEIPAGYYLSNKRTDNKPNSHHASSASIELDGKVIGSCLRAQFYAWKGFPITNEPDIGVLFNFHCGHWFEAMYAFGLDLLKIPHQREVIVNQDWGLDYKIGGRLDFMVADEAVELKTSYGRSMEFDKSWSVVNGKNKSTKGLFKPKDSHALQIAVYLNSGIKVCNNPVFARDSFYRVNFRLNLCEEGIETTNSVNSDLAVLPYTKDKILARWTKLDKCLKDNIAPAPDFDSGYPCKAGKYTCQWYDLCKGENND